MKPHETEITPQTCETYRRLARVMLRHAERMRDNGDLEVADRNLSLALAWLDRLPFVQASTARLYRAAIVYAIEEQPGPMDEHALGILSPEWTEVQMEREHELSLQRKANLTRLRGSQQRAEHISPGDWALLLKALRASQSKVGVIAATWLVCNRATGLRPCEWAEARLEGTALRVKNAKSTHGRSHGAIRTLDMHSARPELLALIRLFLEIVEKNQGDLYKTLYERVRDLIADVARSTLSKRRRYPTLYTGRHLFASSAKSGFTKFEVAALMGHGSIDTASRHYAAARHAKGGRPLEAEPSQIDVAAVHQLNAGKGMQAPLGAPEGGE